MTQREQELLRIISENPQISQQELADTLGIARSSAGVHISNLMKKGHITGKGYIVRQRPYVVVVGGVTRDIGGRPYKTLVPQDSNPAKIRVNIGGVGRNIAHNMSLLGLDVRLVTALAEDDFAPVVQQNCRDLGIDLSGALNVPGGVTATYLYVLDEGGDMAVALVDMDINDHITPAFLQRRQKLLDGAQLVVLDTNIPAESILWLAEHCKAPIFADPVSTAKAGKLKAALGKLHTVKPNRMEAELLTGIPITDEPSLHSAAQAMLGTGLQRVFLSLGADGVYCADQSGGQIVPCVKTELRNATGAGDAFMAALAWAHLEGYDLVQAAKAGLSAAAIAMEGEETVNPDMAVEIVKARYNL